MFSKLYSPTFTTITRLPRKYIKLTSTPTTRRYSSIPLTYTFGGNKCSKFMKISPEVQDALASGAPVVALESGVITNPTETGGIPLPGNIEYAARVESVIREMGAVPATIIIVAGFVYIGVVDADVYQKLTSRVTMKVTQRDLPYVVGMPQRLSGGLTVSATASIAEMVGIKVIATGGIGGVHRSATTLMDISSDVHELGRKKVAVVCSGPKVYLDSMSTIEYLETRGVPVATFGPSMEVMVPAYYSHSGTVKSPLAVKDAQEAAKIIFASHSLGLKTGQLFCNPIPLTQSLNRAMVEKSVVTYFKQRKKGSKKDKEVVADIMEIVRRYSRGAIPAEKTLLLGNARMAASIAMELSKLELAPFELPKATHPALQPALQPTPQPTPQSAPKPIPQSTPQSASQPAPQHASKPTPKPAPKPTQKPVKVQPTLPKPKIRKLFVD